jgi:hypothetical protein
VGDETLHGFVTAVVGVRVDNGLRLGIFFRGRVISNNTESVVGLLICTALLLPGPTVESQLLEICKCEGTTHRSQ